MIIVLCILCLGILLTIKNVRTDQDIDVCFKGYSIKNNYNNRYFATQTLYANFEVLDGLYVISVDCGTSTSLHTDLMKAYYLNDIVMEQNSTIKLRGSIHTFEILFFEFKPLFVKLKPFGCNFLFNK